ncbi:peptide deformylase [Clostridium tagluense]|uniref:Peptide deformylase n=1 Tax=Clostridium tagluense TaxID=360422 RepID=A0A401UIW0_9CLOT|nr:MULTISPECIES: peptide deformylase [Clostridium]MBU3126527.1 peptide deformylase [Clostridium tagluense]MBW9156353.1 peptide deformylase [Clostridium tagluense]MBZ9635867.1 peptide deformylase [Clostridium sp. FP1]MCB2309895.1 peptide deformylase [Clostridium tagluense]MCB2314575.1 peptide deformylase [Clostridium tagluense]
MAIRTIRNYGDELLRKKSRVVDEINPRILLLIKDMEETMYNSKGIGLAAPQVGTLKRIIVIDVGDGPMALINPEILEMQGSNISNEGCLSIPGVQKNVERPEKVTVKAINEKAEEIIINGEGLLARALCHEIDHLDGILFVDKAIDDEEK